MTLLRKIRVGDATGPTLTVEPDGAVLEWSEDGRARLQTADGRSVGVLITLRSGPMAEPSPVEIVVDGWRFVLTIEDEERAALRDRAHRGETAGLHAGQVDVRSVIPGRVVAVDVVEGDIVAVGDRLLVVEAMKMQNEIRSPAAGTILVVRVGVGGTVDIGSVLAVVG